MGKMAENDMRDPLAIWEVRQLNRFVRLAREEQGPAARPSDFIVRSYLNGEAYSEECSEMLAALANSASFRAEVLERIEDSELRFSPELDEEFNNLHVGKMPDFSTYLRKRSSTRLHFKNLFSRLRPHTKHAD